MNTFLKTKTILLTFIKSNIVVFAFFFIQTCWWKIILFTVRNNSRTLQDDADNLDDFG